MVAKTMISMTYEQIAQAVVELPLASQKQLLGLLLAQPGVRDELTNNGSQHTTNSLILEGKKFEEEWIASLKRRPDVTTEEDEQRETQVWANL